MLHDYNLTHKKIKNIYLRIDMDGTLQVTAPMRATKTQIETLILQKSDWITKAITRQQSRQSELIAPIDIEKAGEYLPKRLQELSKLHNLPYNKVTLRNQKTRLGSCSTQKNISLNIRLINLPAQLIDYVILHELAHTRHMNHSKDFWDFLESICPDAKSLHKSLKSKKVE
jgi:predicted metal-dependent hydrolase